MKIVVSVSISISAGIFLRNRRRNELRVGRRAAGLRTDVWSDVRPGSVESVRDVNDVADVLLEFTTRTLCAHKNIGLFIINNAVVICPSAMYCHLVSSGIASPDMTAILLVGTHFIRTSVSFPYMK